MWPFNRAAKARMRAQEITVRHGPTATQMLSSAAGQVERWEKVIRTYEGKGTVKAALRVKRARKQLAYWQKVRELAEEKGTL